MDLISREAVENYVDNMPSELTENGRRMIRAINVKEFIADCPSAFEGMTNGEVIKAVFPNAEVTMPREPLLPTSTVIVDYDENYHNYYRIGWWDSPYKGVSE